MTNKNGADDKMSVTCDKSITDSSTAISMAQRHQCVKLVKELGSRYSLTLGIDLTSIESDKVFKWFIASLLLGGKMNEANAMKAYKEFDRLGILYPATILETNWQKLVVILNRCGYIIDAYNIAYKFKSVSKNLLERYDGDLNRLHFFAEDGRELEESLVGLSWGIDRATINIFLRELRGLWDKAEPIPAKPALLAARKLGLIKPNDPITALEELQAVWGDDGYHKTSFSDIESALVKLGKNYCSRNRCYQCPMNMDCPSQSGGD
jgi:endonuclease III